MGSLRVPRIAIWAAAGCMAGGGAFAAPTDLDAVRSVLLKSNGDDARTREQVVAGLARLGPDAIPVLCGLHFGEGLDELLGDDDGDEERWWCSPDDFDALFLEALGALPPGRVVDYIDEHVKDGAGHYKRLSALQVLGSLGSAECLPALFRLGTSFGHLPLSHRSVQIPLECAFHAVLERDPVRSARKLSELAPDVDQDVLAILTTGIGRTGRPEYVAVLADFVKGEDDLSLAALEQLPELVQRAPWRFDETAGELAREQLGNADWRFRRAAAVACGRIHHAASFRQVALLLDDGNAAVANTARWTLEQLSATEIVRTSTEWLEWHDRESAWWKGRRTELLQKLGSSEPRGSAEALRELLAHPLFREEIAAELAELLEPLLSRGEKNHVLCVVDALQQLGSPRAVPSLVDLLDARDADLRAAAAKALASSTGADLPPETSAWRAFVQG